MGKTSLTLRFCKNTFDGGQISTIDASHLTQIVTLSTGSKYQLNIWDTAGQEKYRALNKVYYQGAEGKYNKNHLKIGALIVYDITDHESWLKVTSWMKELQMYLPPDTPIVITGNKADLPNR